MAIVNPEFEMADSVAHLVVWLWAHYFLLDVQPFFSWGVGGVDPVVEIHMDLLNSCSGGFDENSSNPETSSGCTSS